LHFTAAASTLLDFGTVPETSLGVSISAGIVVQRFRVELLGGFEPKHDVALAGRAGVGAGFSKWSAGVRGCFAVLEGRLELGPCMGGEFIDLEGRSFGISQPKDYASTWAEVLAGAGARFQLWHPFGVRLDGALGFPLRRLNVVIEPYGVVHTVPMVTGRTTLSLDLRF
jgi:hypothetical protein